MGIRITDVFADYGHSILNGDTMSEKTVFRLADHALKNTLKRDTSYSHLLAATSCPDSIAPSLGQCINQYYNDKLSSSHTIDIVQGCAGGISALIIASQLAELNKSNVLVVAADAAQKATSPSSEIFKVFNNGVFACCVSYSEDDCRLVYHQSKQYKDLYSVVTIGLGHDADTIIAQNIDDMTTDPRKHLGLRLHNHLALKLMMQAEKFYLDFVEHTGHPDFLILHQVNEAIINHLEKVFSKYPVRFVNRAKETGNCGCATTGILLYNLAEEVNNKKVMICSFGTGGVITAGLWQF